MTKQELEQLKTLIMRSYEDIDSLITNFWDTEAHAYLIDTARTHLQSALNIVDKLE